MRWAWGALACAAAATALAADVPLPWLDELARVHHLDQAARDRITSIATASGRIGEGNPALTQHPISREECQARGGALPPDPAMEALCGGPYMVPLYDPRTEAPSDARACIDQYEFPNVPCAYPVVWVRAKEAAEICQAMGKRLCDAHEWEGACAGALEAPDDLSIAAGLPDAAAFDLLRRTHNARFADEKSRTWAYGPTYRSGVCATGSHKSPHCPGGSYASCGSNTYPTGAFPDCKSPLGVYDQHGNAAEHMNLPVRPEDMASLGSTTLGLTEMKGSWFVFDEVRAHEDWCRWRAPYWHGSRVMDADSHRNYHLGFRCCRSIVPQSSLGTGPGP